MQFKPYKGVMNMFFCRLHAVSALHRNYSIAICPTVFEGSIRKRKWYSGGDKTLKSLCDILTLFNYKSLMTRNDNYNIP